MRLNPIECTSVGKEEEAESFIVIRPLENFIANEEASLFNQQEVPNKKGIINSSPQPTAPSKTQSTKKVIPSKPKTFYSKKFIESNASSEKAFFSNKRIYLYKTEMCRSYSELGYCKYGERCQFSHSNVELRDVSRHPKYKTETCRVFWEQGTCPYGKRCCFLHTGINLDEEELLEQKPIVLFDLSLYEKVGDEELKNFSNNDTVDNLVESAIPLDKSQIRSVNIRSLKNTPIDSEIVEELKMSCDDFDFTPIEESSRPVKEVLLSNFIDRFFNIENLSLLLQAREEHREVDYTFIDVNSLHSSNATFTINASQDINIWTNQD